MSLRLLVGVVYAVRLAWCSTAITADELTELGVDPQSLAGQKRPTPIAECPLIRVPLAVGVVRPRILLPSDWPTWPAEKLQAVIAHERTHIQRGDGAVVLLAELNRCLYWFHALAWCLRTHLGKLACDDAAIDSASYARDLLEVAAAVSGGRSRLVSAGRAGPSAPVSASNQRGASPRRGLVLNPVSESNCVLVKEGGEQLEENDQSAG